VSVLVVAEHVRGRVRDVTYELVTAGRQLGGPVAVAVIGRDPAALDVQREGVDEVAVSYTHLTLPTICSV